MWKVLLEIVAELALGRVCRRCVGPAVAVVAAPDAEGQAFAHVAEHDLDSRVLVEQARRHQTQRMHGGLLSERPGRAEQPGVPFVDLRHAGQRVARMQVERRVERGHRAPERPVLRKIVVDRRIGLVDLGKAVHIRAHEAELLHAALKLPRRRVGILHRKRGEAEEPVGALGDFLGEEVVGLRGDRDGLGPVVDSLHRRRVERQDHDLDPVRVHLADPPVVEVEQPAAQLLPRVLREVARGVAQRVLYREMFFERDLAVHRSFLPRNAATRRICTNCRGTGTPGA